MVDFGCTKATSSRKLIPPHWTIAAQPSTHTWRIIIEVNGKLLISSMVNIRGFSTSPSIIKRYFSWLITGVNLYVLIINASGSISFNENSGTGV